MVKLKRMSDISKAVAAAKTALDIESAALANLAAGIEKNIEQKLIYYGRRFTNTQR